MHTKKKVVSSLLILSLLLGVASIPAGADDWSDARKAFRRAQKSDDWKIRRDVYQRMLEFDDEKAVDEVLRAMSREESPAVLVTGMETLATFISDEAIATLVKALTKTKGSDRLPLIVAMGMRLDDAGSDVLLQIATGKDAQAAAQAALSLGQRRVMDATQIFLSFLSRDEWQLRAAGARAIRLLAGPPPEKPLEGQKEGPWLPKDFDADLVLPGLVEALGATEGRARADVIQALERITRQHYGNDVKAWQALVSGTPPDKIKARPPQVPHIFGIPIYGKRVVLLVDISTCTDDTHPFGETDRLKEVCKVPGARSVPWYKIRTTKQLIRAYSTRLIQDLPPGSKFDVIAVYQKYESLFGRLTNVNPGTQRNAATFLEELAIQGGPNHYLSMNAALDISGKKDSVAWSLGPDEIILMTCAIPWAPKDKNAIVNQEEVGRIIGLKARLRMVPIDTIGVGPHPFGMMRQISDLSGGTYVDLHE